MGSSSSNETKAFNCIKQQYHEHIRSKNYEKYDMDGNIIYTLQNRFEGIDGEIFKVLDIGQKQIGLIKRRMNDCYGCSEQYTLFNDINNAVGYIDFNNGCCSKNYIFYDANKNIESTILIKSKCCKLIFTEYDKYNTINSFAENYQSCCNNDYYCEYDQSRNLIFKTKIFKQSTGRLIKIYDNNDIEVDLTDKTLFNKRYTKIQLLIIFREALFRQEASFNNSYPQTTVTLL